MAKIVRLGRLFAIELSQIDEFRDKD
ncbi:Putative uncharacterized protein [Lacticaseibacillus paracasei]|nr:Putative uncharacterized protein [Lacticaseibacillus paracasei]